MGLVESRCPACSGPLVAPTFAPGEGLLLCHACATAPLLDADTA